MGSARLDFYGLCRLINLRQYNGCVSFVPAPGFEDYGEPTTYPGKPTSKGDSSDPSEVEPVNLQRLCYTYQGPEINLENLNWRVINGPFVSVWLHNLGVQKTQWQHLTQRYISGLRLSLD
ncbi:sphingosine kinase 1-like isoform X2 [Lotus japonicus]|uniref:sphingosine kinase 1-like isoform X2 n=1 Tax=Lotus japonicus TaxID=34305 RepID=UPI00258AEE2C|nr:sphingosine kinase 1-like isoform X2 [Lotus japonicus]